MLKRVRLTNYRCLRDVDVELAPLTVVIGKNDTGKTSFLDALHRLARFVGGTETFESPSSVESLSWRGAAPPSLGWEVEVAPTPRDGLPAHGQYRVLLQATKPFGERVESEQATFDDVGDVFVRRQDSEHCDVKDGDRATSISGNVRTSAFAQLGDIEGYPRLLRLSGALRATTFHRFDLDVLRRPSELVPRREGDAPRLGADGSDLAVVLDFMLGARRQQFFEIQRELMEAMPHVKELLVRPATLGVAGKSHAAKAVGFALEGGGEISAALASDGVLLFLAYLTMIHADDPPAVILLEEPENGVHPRSLGRLIEILRRITDPGRGARAAQVVLATHSPYLLDHVPPEGVRVFGRRRNGETVVENLLDVPGVPERLASGFSLGEMWFNVGEDELLRGTLDADPGRQ